MHQMGKWTLDKQPILPGLHELYGASWGAGGLTYASTLKVSTKNTAVICRSIQNSH